MKNEQHKEQTNAIYVAMVIAYLAASRIIISPESDGFLEGLFASSYLKALMLEPGMAPHALYSSLKTGILISVIAIAYFTYIGSTTKIKVSALILSILAGSKWVLEYAVLTSFLNKTTSGYDIKHYVYIVFILAILGIVGMAIEIEENQ
ncbi:hypothetical protein [Alcanivorax sp. 24]|uniref:hypothetical protein n=1 Tax=Alcanivorax sp. 24 TaxID=2545266 RepID=UPI0010601B3F|nr:hypothetical protein [Alcanivorax sp. 24]